MTLRQVMERFRVPGVSVAVIKDFAIHWAKGYGVADVESGAAVENNTALSGGLDQQAGGGDGGRACRAGRPLRARRRHQHDPEVVEDAGERAHARPSGHAARALSHTSGLGDGFGFPGYHPSAPRPTVVEILNGRTPSNVGPVLMERPPFTAFKYSGGGVAVMQLAMMETFREPYAGDAAAARARPDRDERQHLRAAALERTRQTCGACAQRRRRAMDAKWHVYPELAAAGLWTTSVDLARFAIEVQKTALGKSSKVLTQASVREMLSPVGVGDYAVGLSVTKMAARAGTSATADRTGASSAT